MPSVREKPECTSPRGTWRARVLNEARRLENDLVSVPPEAAAPIRKNIECARAVVTHAGPLDRLRDWLSGAAFETAWASLHAADELLTLVQPPEDIRAGITDIVAELDASLKPNDRRLARYRMELGLLAAGREELPPEGRAQVRAARRTANTAKYVSQGVVRRWRNLLLGVGTAVFVVLVVLAAVDLLAPGFHPLGGATGPAGDSTQVWEVELMGAFGGAIAAVLAISRFSGNTDPNGLPLYQALLRIPMAAAAAVFGVLLMQSGVVAALESQPPNAVLAYAIFFGYAQEPLLRMIDRRAGEVLEPARGKDDPGTHPSSAEPAAAELKLPAAAQVVAPPVRPSPPAPG